MKNFWKVPSTLQLDPTVGFSDKLKSIVNRLEDGDKATLEASSELIFSLHGAPAMNLTEMFLGEVRGIDKNLAERLDYEIAGMANVADTRKI